jgi:type I restriction enzyme S subunit
MATKDTICNNVPRLRFVGFKDDWSTLPLGKIYSQIRNGFVGTATPYYVSNGHKYLQGKDIKKGTIQNTVDVYVSDEFYQKNKKSILKSNDIVMVQSGHVGECAVVTGSTAGANCHAVIVMTSSKPVISAYFVFYFYSKFGKAKIHKVTTGNTIQHILSSEMKKMLVPYCSEKEQEKIAMFLTAVDDKITTLGSKVDLLKTYKKCVIKKIFTQEIRFKDEQGNLYPNWQEKKLSQLNDEKLIELGRGDVISKTDIINKPGDYPIYSSSVKNNGLFGHYGKYMFDEELITWSIDGGGDFFYRPSGKFSVTNVSGWLRVLNRSLNCKFLLLQLQILHERQVFDYQTKAHPSVIRGLYRIKIPVIEEQKKIAEFLTILDNRINTEEERLTIAKNFKSALLQVMFL